MVLLRQDLETKLAATEASAEKYELKCQEAQKIMVRFSLIVSCACSCLAPGQRGLVAAKVPDAYESYAVGCCRSR